MNHKASASLVVCGVDSGTKNLGIAINNGNYHNLNFIMDSPEPGEWPGETYLKIFDYIKEILSHNKIGLICIEQAFHSFKGDNSTAICSALIEAAAASCGLNEANIHYFSPQGWRSIIGYPQPHHYSETKKTKKEKPVIRKATPTEKKWDKKALNAFIRARLHITGDYTQDQIEAAGIALAGRIWAAENVEVET